MEIQNTYLFRVYREFKLLFVVIIIWAIGTLWFALKSHEEFPFLLFGMYSLKEEGKDEYSRCLVYVNGAVVEQSLFCDSRFELIYSPVENLAFADMGKNEKKEKWNELGKWLSNYGENDTSISKVVTIRKHTVNYRNDGHQQSLNFEKLFSNDPFEK